MELLFIGDATLTVPFFGNWRQKKMTKMEIATPESRAAARTSVVILAPPVSAMTT